MDVITRTTITIPENTLQALKLRAVHEKTSVSAIITHLVKKELKEPMEKVSKRDPMKSLGGFKIGIKKIYTHRDELYTDHLKHKMGS